MSAAEFNICPSKCATDPLPEEARFSFPGLALAYATNSLTLLIGKEGLITMTNGKVANEPIGARSFSVSNGMVL